MAEMEPVEETTFSTDAVVEPGHILREGRGDFMVLSAEEAEPGEDPYGDRFAHCWKVRMVRLGPPPEDNFDPAATVHVMAVGGDRRTT